MTQTLSSKLVHVADVSRYLSVLGLVEDFPLDSLGSVAGMTLVLKDKMYFVNFVLLDASQLTTKKHD